MRISAPISLVALCLLLATPALAENCYADYKAKQNNPLRLHYGVAQINAACTKAAAQADLQQRLKSGGWVLLTVLSVFDGTGLEGKNADARQFYLRY